MDLQLQHGQMHEDDFCMTTWCLEYADVLQAVGASHCGGEDFWYVQFDKYLLDRVYTGYVTAGMKDSPVLRVQSTIRWCSKYITWFKRALTC